MNRRTLLQMIGLAPVAATAGSKADGMRPTGKLPKKVRGVYTTGNKPLVTYPGLTEFFGATYTDKR